MTYDVDLNEMKAYILNKFKNEGDFDFLKEGLMEELVDEMMSVDQAYLAKLSEDDDYEDETYTRCSSPPFKINTQTTRCMPCALPRTIWTSPRSTSSAWMR